jgi:hypothetical protein
LTKTDKLVDSKIIEFLQQIDSSNTKKHQITLQFYEKKPKKSWFTKEDDTCWEEWTIEVLITRAKTEREQIVAKTQLQKDLKQCLIHISTESGNKRDHIPPIINSDPFPYQVNFSHLDDPHTHIGNFMDNNADELNSYFFINCILDCYRNLSRIYLQFPSIYTVKQSVASKPSTALRKT